ncbi:MAG: hypothetical protein AAGF53_18835 [Pseudomonadota bacterium]
MRNSLRKELSSLRKAMSQFDPVFFEIDRDAVRIKRDSVWIDVFDGDNEDWPRFLEGVDLPDADALEDWLRECRDHQPCRSKAPGPQREPNSLVKSSSEADASMAETHQNNSAQTRPPALHSRGVPITVLPFEEGTVSVELSRSLGGGISEAIRTSLSRFRSLIVVSPGTKGLSEAIEGLRPADIGHLFNVNYLVQGRVRTLADRFRVSIELVDCSNERVVWADLFDGNIEHLFEFEEEMSAQIAGRVDPYVVWSEYQKVARQRPESLAAYECVLRSMPEIYRSDRTSFDDVGRLLLRAIDIDPKYSDAYSWRAFWCMHSIGQGWQQDVALGVAEAADRAQEAIRLDPNNALALAVAGHVEAFLHQRLQNAKRLLARSISINPNSGLARAFNAVLFCYLGRPTDALAQMEIYERLCPFDPASCYFRTIYVIAHTLLNEFEAAVQIGREVFRENPNFVNGYKPLLVSLWHLGERDEATYFASRILAEEPDFTIAKFRRTYPLQDQRHVLLYEEAFRGTGIP